jgi:ribosomal protein L30/L7E
MSHIRCMYHPRNTTPKWARIVEQSRIVGMVSHVSHSVHVPPKNTFTRWARIVGTVQDGWDGLTCLIRCMYLPRNTFTQRWARIVEGQSRIVGMVSHVSHSVHVPPKEHLHQRWARIVEDSPG